MKIITKLLFLTLSLFAGNCGAIGIEDVEILKGAMPLDRIPSYMYLFHRPGEGVLPARYIQKGWGNRVNLATDASSRVDVSITQSKALPWDVTQGAGDENEDRFIIFSNRHAQAVDFVNKELLKKPFSDYTEKDLVTINELILPPVMTESHENGLGNTLKSGSLRDRPVFFPKGDIGSDLTSNEEIAKIQKIWKRDRSGNGMYDAIRGTLKESEFELLKKAYFIPDEFSIVKDTSTSCKARLLAANLTHLVKFLHTIRVALRQSIDGMHPIILAAIVHRQFVSKLPFTKGNGKMARLLMNITLMQAGYPPVIFFDYSEYIAAVRAGEKSLDAFVEYICKNMIETFYRHTTQYVHVEGNKWCACEFCLVDCGCFFCKKPEVRNHIMKNLIGCHKCGMTAAQKSKEKLSLCGGCKIRRYCSAECQKADWKDHKKRCDFSLHLKKQDEILKAIMQVQLKVVEGAVVLNLSDDNKSAGSTVDDNKTERKSK